MDWHFALFVMEEGIPGVAALALTLPVFALCGKSGCRLLASSSTVAAIGTFAVSALAAGSPGIESSTWGEYLPMIGFGVVLLLLMPSVLVLQRRWHGLLHVVTVAASVYLMFISILAMSHDYP